MREVKQGIEDKNYMIAYLGIVQKELVLSTGVPGALLALPVRYKAAALLLAVNPKPQYKNTTYFFTTP